MRIVKDVRGVNSSGVGRAALLTRCEAGQVIQFLSYRIVTLSENTQVYAQQGQNHCMIANRNALKKLMVGLVKGTLRASVHLLQIQCRHFTA